MINVCGFFITSNTSHFIKRNMPTSTHQDIKESIDCQLKILNTAEADGTDSALSPRQEEESTTSGFQTI